MNSTSFVHTNIADCRFDAARIVDSVRIADCLRRLPEMNIKSRKKKIHNVIFQKKIIIANQN